MRNNARPTPDQLVAYERIKAHGYRIDSRGPLPVLIRGTWGRQFLTYADALEAARRDHANRMRVTTPRATCDICGGGLDGEYGQCVAQGCPGA